MEDLPRFMLAAESVKFIDTKLKECISQHSRCRRANTSYPSRLLRIKPAENHFDRALNTSGDLSAELYRSWRHLLVKYTRCEMTKDSNKLVALDGIAQETANFIGSKFIYGMREDFLLQGSLWEPAAQHGRSPVSPLLEWHAPSWSWASGNHYVKAEDYWLCHAYCSNRKHLAVVRATDTKTHLSGQLPHALLTLRGRILRAEIETDTDYWRSCTKISLRKGKIVELRWNEECIFNHPPIGLYKEDLTFTAIAKCFCTFKATNKLGSETEMPSLAALMLRKVATNPRKYCRVGILRLQGLNCNSFFAEESRDEHDTVMI
jgi:hypothetical protein